MLPARIIDGIAHNTPVKKRPIITVVIDGIAATRTQKKEKQNVARIYNFFRPNDSEYGGNNTPPTAWPSR